MISQWTKNCTSQEDKDRFTKYLIGSKTILERLAEILKEEENSLDRSETNPEAYETPSWAARQAHKNGFRQCLNKIQTIINLDQKEN